MADMFSFDRKGFSLQHQDDEEKSRFVTAGKRMRKHYPTGSNQLRAGSWENARATGSIAVLLVFWRRLSGTSRGAFSRVVDASCTRSITLTSRLPRRLEGAAKQ